MAFSFVALGVSSLVAQVLLIRELLIVSYGNEFFIGWTLFSWLFWVAAGALLCGRRLAGLRNPAIGVVLCHAVSALLLPGSIALIRHSRPWTGGGPGTVPDILPAMILALGALAPLCFVLGLHFVLGARAWKIAGGGGEFGSVAGRAYACETAGFVAGGILFSYGFVVMNEFRVAGLLGGLNIAAGAVLLSKARVRSTVLWGVLAAALAGLLPLFLFAARIDRTTSGWRYPGQRLVETRNSIHGHLAVTALGRQISFYENGLLLGAEDEQMAAEQLVHFPMLWHPNPRQVLLVGGGFNGALGEILQHKPDRVDYVELDPVWIDLAREHAAPARRRALEDSRVNRVFADARFFLKPRPDVPQAIYDVVILNLPNPGTVLINRCYSLEFFRDVHRRMAPGGVLAVRLAFSPDYLSRELNDLGASIHRTLRAVFDSVAILPEYEIFYLATAGGAAPSPAPADLIARYGQRGLRTDFVTPSAIEYRLTTDRIGQVRTAFEANDHAQLNRDTRPMACHYTFVYWLSAFHSRAAAWASRAGEVRWPGPAAAALVVVAMGFSIRGRGTRRLGAWAMGIGSFTLMACELVLLLAFQVFCGYLYYKIALILAALMLGMALGTALGTRIPGGARPWMLAGIHGLLAIYAAGLAGSLRLWDSTATGGSPGIEWAILLMAGVVGGLVGLEFPVANRIYLDGAAEDARQAGVIYGVDLMGSCVAALAIGFWALPVLGLIATVLLLAALNAATALIAISPGFSRHPAQGCSLDGSGPRSSLCAR